MNALIAHGGGPTSVINASLAGLVAESQARGIFKTIYGARFGVRGILEENFTDLLQVDADSLERIGRSTGSALGSSRSKLSDNDYKQIFETFRRREIRCFFYTGGNGSMATALRIESDARARGYDLQVIGIPKTIDNDLCVTDHTPGYPSTAHFFAIAARDVGEDNRSLPPPISVLEVLGRNAGWVAAATALARAQEEDAPHLIYFPERPVSLEQIATDAEQVYRRLGRVLIAICEGQLDETGTAFGADVDRPDSAVHRLASNLGHTLARLLSAKLKLRARSEKPGLFGRCCGPLASKLDRAEARECGRAAAQAAANGESRVMIAMERDCASPYHARTFLTPLESVAGRERLLPPHWINHAGNNVTNDFIEYVSPLVPAVQPYPHL